MRLIDKDKLLKDMNCTGRVNNGWYIDKVKQQPTVEENKWISVDDELPKEKGFYSVTIFRENAKLEKLYTRELRFDGKRFDGFLGEKILAWQPLPKPYEPKGSE